MADKYLLEIDGTLHPIKTDVTIGVNKRIRTLKPNDERQMTDGRFFPRVDDYHEWEVAQTTRAVQEKPDEYGVFEDVVILHLKRIPDEQPATA